jgi:hypothetical protein
VADIYIVSLYSSGPYTQNRSSYHRTEEAAAEAFEACKDAVGEDQTLLEIVRLDSETLRWTYLTGWEGNRRDLEDEWMEEERDLPEDAGPDPLSCWYDTSAELSAAPTGVAREKEEA